MANVTKPQLQMLRDLDDGDPTDFADFADRAGCLGWLNRDRVMKALERKGLIDDDNKLTEAGRNALASTREAGQ